MCPDDGALKVATIIPRDLALDQAQIVDIGVIGEPQACSVSRIYKLLIRSLNDRCDIRPLPQLEEKLRIEIRERWRLCRRERFRGLSGFRCRRLSRGSWCGGLACGLARLAGATCKSKRERYGSDGQDGSRPIHGPILTPLSLERHPGRPSRAGPTPTPGECRCSHASWLS